MTTEDQSTTPTEQKDTKPTVDPRPPLWARAGTRISSLLRSPGRLLVLAVIAMLLLNPVAGGLIWQRLISVYDDFFFDPTKEGLIVVDSPQVFTRERLVNQRLRDSAWIDRQLEAVDEMLERGDFSKPDVLSDHQLTVSLLKGMVPSPDGATATDAAGSDQRETSLEGLKDLIQPDPISVFREAQFYREMLTQSRYESILDDAHDIGSNTLQKLNFRMTVTPARRKSDSLAAVTITIEEPENVEHLFQYYGKLLIETREEVEDTVARLTQDRNQILNPGSSYAYQAETHMILDQVLNVSYHGLFGNKPSLQSRAQLINAAINLEQEQHERRVANWIRKTMMEGAYPDLVNKLFSKRKDDNKPTDDGKQRESTQPKPTDFEDIATKTAMANCNQNLSLMDLAPEIFKDSPLLDTMQREYRELRGHQSILRELARKPGEQNTGQGGENTENKTSGNDPNQSPARSDNNESLQTGQNPTAAPKPSDNGGAAAVGHGGQPRTPTPDVIAGAEFYKFMNSRNYRAPCPINHQINVRAKLRVVGALQLLGTVTSENWPCGNDPAQEAKLVEQTLSIFMSRSEDPENKAGDFSDRNEARQTLLACQLDPGTLRSQLPPSSSRWDIGQIGVSHLVLEELTSTQIDSMIRVKYLKDYFSFDIDQCAPLSCDVSARTLAEQKRFKFLEKTRLPQEPGGVLEKADIESDRVNRKLVREIGREEALRLYAELSCFARARSYTVWPRSGETKRALTKNTTGFEMLGDLMSRMTAGTAASTSSASFSETQHVFGIGDGGQPIQSQFAECDTPFYWMLDRFVPDGKFVQNFISNSDLWNDANDATRAWKYQIMCRIAERRATRADLIATSLDTRTPAQLRAVMRVLSGDQRRTLMSTGRTELNRDQVGELRDRLGPDTLAKLALVPRSGIDGWSDMDCDQSPAALAEDIQSRDHGVFARSAHLGDFMAVTRARRDYDTNVSWVVIPEQDSALTPKRHVAKSVPLSAIVSLPSWWPSARITVRTCWLRPKTMMQNLSGADFCKEPSNRGGTLGRLGLIDRLERKSLAAQTSSVFPVRLPSNAQDVLQKLGFFIIRAPYLSIQGAGAEPIVVQAGRPAEIRLTGKRLWKNPRVRLGSQWHTEIEVLPDMKGIIARFKCVGPTIDPSFSFASLSNETLIDVDVATDIPSRDNSRQSRPQRDEQRVAEVWTSEGVTSTVAVQVRPFRPSYKESGVLEKPCWPDMKDTETSAALPEPPNSSLIDPGAAGGQDGN